MARLHFVGGEKGGVGRSVVAKLLAQYWVDTGVSWTGFDGDRSHPSFLRPYADFVERLEVTRATDLDRTVEALEAGRAEVVVDLPGQSAASLFHWWNGVDLGAFLAARGHEPWFWHVMDPTRDSLLQLEALLDRLEPSVRVVCVLNHGRSRSFQLFHESKLRSRLEQRGGRLLEVPELQPDAMATIDAHDLSFWAAVHQDDPERGPCLPLLSRQRVRVFVRRSHERFAELLGGPPPA